MAEKHRELVVVGDPNADECLYVNGQAWEFTGETTVYATDFEEAANGEPCLIRLESIDHVHEQWPKTLEEALRQPLKLADVE